MQNKNKWRLMSLDMICFFTGSSVVMLMSLVQERHRQFIGRTGKISSGLFSWTEFPTLCCIWIYYIFYIIIFIDILILKRILCLLSRKKVLFLAGIAGASQLFGLHIDEPLIAVKPFPVRLEKKWGSHYVFNGLAVLNVWQVWESSVCVWESCFGLVIF